MTVHQQATTVKHVYALYDENGIFMGHMYGTSHDDAADRFHRTHSSTPRPSLIDFVR